MNWTGWVLLGVTLLSLYLLGLTGYRLFLNAKALKQHIDKAKGLVVEAQNFEELEVSAAKPSSSEDLDELLVERRALLRAKEDRASARQRRLVQRISEIEIDKREA
jgi:hypothetical protein